MVDRMTRGAKKGGKKMRGWLRRVKWDAVATVVVLIFIFLLAMFIRSYWYWGPAVDKIGTYGDEAYLLSGNDPNYHKRTVDFIQETHHHLVIDPMLNYPQTGANPNPPIYAWSIALMGYLLSPFYGGDVHMATWIVMEYAAALWAALTIFPTYVFARDMFGRKTGIIAAFFLAVMAGNVERTPVGFSDHDGIMMFFVVLAFLFLMRAMRALKSGTYIKSYMMAGDITDGFLRWARTNRKAILNAVMAGIAIAAIGLTWKGVAYVYAIIFIYFIVHMTILKIKKEDNLGLSMVVLITLGLPLLVIFPYYYIPSFWEWYTSLAYLFVGVAIFALMFMWTRDIPWLVVIPTVFGLVAGGMAAISYVYPEMFQMVVSLSGYFIKTKLYTTIAEAQAPDFSRMIFSYGIITSYLALVGVGWAAWKLPSEKWRNDYIVTIIWAGMAIYMAMSAVRFMYNATPVFAIMSAWITYEIIRMTDFGTMWRNYSNLRRGQRWYAFKESVKPRHVVVTLFVVGLIVFPNTWYGIDAGIPYETKRKYDEQIHDAYIKVLPTQLRGVSDKEYKSLGSGTWFLGSFGTAYPSDYWVDGLYWLADQDNQSMPEDRPAFISWWDYGHWAVHMGQHPSAADNFQNSFQWAGQFISAQNESETEALMAVKIWEGVRIAENDDSVDDLLLAHMTQEEFDLFYDYWSHPTDYVDLIHKDPLKYGPRSDDIDIFNARYLLTTRVLMDIMDPTELDQMLWELEYNTGKSMRYFAVDSRLMPFNPTNTGIFYAPIKLSDQNIDDFIYVNAISKTGGAYKLGSDALTQAQQDDPDFGVDHYEIVYQKPFFNSMFYKAYIGWQPLDLDINEMAVPIVSNPADVGRQDLEVRSIPPLQGWGMEHYKLEYRTVYWNPNTTDLEAHREEWEVIPPAEAAVKEANGDGTVDWLYRGLYSGVFFLKFYHGAYVNGTVTTSEGEPVVNATVTVYDDMKTAKAAWPGVPHDSVKTDALGRYSLLAPPGNDTIVVSNGGQGEGNEMREALLMMRDKRILSTTTVNITDEQAMRLPTDENGDGTLDYNVRHDVKVEYGKMQGRAYWDMDLDKKWTEGADVPMTGEMSLVNTTLGIDRNVTLAEDGEYMFENIIPNTYSLLIKYKGLLIGVKEVGIEVGDNITEEAVLPAAYVTGNITSPASSDGEVVDTRVVLDDRGGTPAAVWTNDTVNGTFMLGPVYPGNYTIRTDDPEYRASAVDVDIDIGTNVSLNVSLERTAGLTGKLTYTDGAPAAMTVMIFSTMEPSGSDVKVATDTAGQYTAHLSRGNYTIYAINMRDGQTQVAIGGVRFGEEAMTKDLTMMPSVKVNGTAFFDRNGNGTYDGARYDYLVVKKNLEQPDTLYIKGEEAAEVEVVLQGDTGNYTMRTNKGGYYEAMLPVGKYTIRAYSTASNETYTYLDMIDLQARSEKDLPLTKGTLVRGTVYQDVNDDDLPDPDEYIVGFDVVYELVGLPDEKGVADTVPDLRSGIDHMSAITDADGVYSMFLTTNASYKLSVNVPGYEPYSDLLNIPVDQMQRNVKLTPSNITVSGKAQSMVVGTATGQSVNVTFRATYRGKDATARSGDDGSYSIQLTPGIYRVTVDAFKQQDGASVAYSFSTELNVSIGSAPITLDIPLAIKYKVSGKAFFDLNGDGLPSRDEVRGPSIRFVDSNGLVSSATASAVDGKFETYLSIGKYSVYAKLNEIGVTERIMTYLDGLEVKGEETLSVQLHESVRLDGVIYFDQNRDGKMDDTEPEGIVLLNISDMTGMDMAKGPAGAPMVNVTGDMTGSYSIHVPSNRTYMLWVDSLVPALTENDVTMAFAGSKVVKVSEDQRQFMQDIAIEISVLVSGQVMWDWSGSSSGIPGVQVAFGNATAMTNATGNYSLFVRPDTYVVGLKKDGFVTPESAVEEKTPVDKARTIFTFYMDALNVSYGGVAFVDTDGDGNRTAGELGFAMDIVFKPIDVDPYGDTEKVNVTARTNRRGEFRTALPVGNYEVLIDAVDEDSHRHYVFDDLMTVTPLEGPITRDIPLREASMLRARILYNGTTGDDLQVPLVNITFKDMSRTVKKDFTNVTSDALLYLQPSGGYIVESTFEQQESGRTVTYRLIIEGLDMNGSRTMDLFFEKDRIFATELTWDEKERAHVYQNATVLYNVSVKNVGNEADNFDIQLNQPSGWVATAEEAGTGSPTEQGTEVKKVYLALDQEYRFQVRLNVSKIATADDNPITVSLMSEAQGASNSTTLHVDVFQEFNLTFGETSTQPTLSSEGAVEYNVIVKNDGNGKDSVKMTISPISGWNITMEPETFDVAASGTQNVRVMIMMEESGKPVETVLYVKAHSEDGKTMGEHELDVTFPDLTANVTVSGDKVEDTKTQPAPGFEALVFIVAVGIAVVIIKRRGRKEDGGEWE